MSIYQQGFEEFKENYMMYIPLSIIFQSCLGSVSVMYILMRMDESFFSFLQLFLCVASCMLYNASIMAQLNVKIVYKLLLISVLLNTLFILINFI